MNLNKIKQYYHQKLILISKIDELDRKLKEDKIAIENKEKSKNEEHKLISESLYKLAVHFMSLKDDLQKKINNNNNK